MVVVLPIRSSIYPLQSVESSHIREKRARLSAFTLLEVMVAAGVFALAFAGLYAAANHVMNMIRRAEDSAVAQRNCLARIDQLRSTGWANLARPEFLAAMLTAPTGDAVFDRETISVFATALPKTLPEPMPAPPATPPPSPNPLYTVTKAKGSAPVITPPTFTPEMAVDEYQLNFRVLTEWHRAGKVRQRELSTIISKSADQ